MGSSLFQFRLCLCALALLLVLHYSVKRLLVVVLFPALNLDRFTSPLFFFFSLLLLPIIDPFVHSYHYF